MPPKPPARPTLPSEFRKAPPAPPAPPTKKEPVKRRPKTYVEYPPVKSRKLNKNELIDLKAEVDRLARAGKSDLTIASVLNIEPVEAARVRNLGPDLKVQSKSGKACSRIRRKEKHPPTRKASDTAFGGPKGNKSNCRIELDEFGLPVRHGCVKPVGAVDVVTFLEKLSQYSIEELEELIEMKQMDGKGLSINTVSLARLYLDSLTAPRSVDRCRATQLILNRRFGLPTAKVANADGSNINPLTMLLTEQSRLQPVEE